MLTIWYKTMVVLSLILVVMLLAQVVARLDTVIGLWTTDEEQTEELSIEDLETGPPMLMIG